MATFLAAQQNGHTFSCKKPSLIQSPVEMAKFFWPIGDHIKLMWFHYNKFVTLTTGISLWPLIKLLCVGGLSTQVIHFYVNLYKGYNSTVETAKISKVN